MSDKKIQVEFAPGCFDGFEGTQEELDALIAEIKQLAESGELQEQSKPITEDSLDDLSDEEVEMLTQALKQWGTNERQKKIQ